MKLKSTIKFSRCWLLLESVFLAKINYERLHGFTLSLKWLVRFSVGRPEEIEEHNQAFELLATA